MIRRRRCSAWNRVPACNPETMAAFGYKTATAVSRSRPGRRGKAVSGFLFLKKTRWDAFRFGVPAPLPRNEKNEEGWFSD